MKKETKKKLILKESQIKRSSKKITPSKEVSTKKESSKKEVDYVSILIEVSSKEVFLKSIQKQRLKRLIKKAHENKDLTDIEKEYLLEMRHRIRCYLVSNSTYVDYSLNKIVKDDLLSDSKAYVVNSKLF